MLSKRPSRWLPLSRADAATLLSGLCCRHRGLGEQIAEAGPFEDVSKVGDQRVVLGDTDAGVGPHLEL